jgi:hypothetical protein
MRFPSPPAVTPAWIERVGEIDSERASTAAPVPAESPIVETSDSDRDGYAHGLLLSVDVRVVPDLESIRN